MSEPTPSMQTPQETVDYQPISGWAIAGFAISVAFAALVALCAVVGLFQAAPVFFPSWVLTLALAGFVLSLIGQQHVKNSDGTRVGAKLARMGLWISLISGLCYFSYYSFTGLALKKQANDFVMEMGEDSGFFPRLRAGTAKPEELNAAYLLTLSPTARAGASPRDEAAMRLLDAPQRDGSPGKLSNFKEGFFPRLFFGKLGTDAEITPQAVLEWNYEQGSYKIRRWYNVKTSEVDVDIMMTVQSSEADSAGQNRKWFVNLNETHPQLRQMKLTAVGSGVRLLRERSKKQLEDWIGSINAGQAVRAFQDRDRTVWSRLELAGRDQTQRARIKALLPSVKQAFTGNEEGGLASFAVMTKPDDVGRWEQVNGKIRIYHTFIFKLGIGAMGPSGLVVAGHVAMDTRQAIDPEMYGPTAPPPEWELDRFVIDQAIVPPSPVMKKGGP